MAAIFHGGCFTEGESSWDKELAETLMSMGFFAVIRFGFPKDKGVQGVLDYAVESLDDFGLDLKVVAIGVSSGGFFAAAALSLARVSCAFGICPILSPALRASLLKDASITAKTETFFGSAGDAEAETERVLALATASGKPMAVIRSPDDPMAPEAIFAPWESMLTATITDPRGLGHGLCKDVLWHQVVEAMAACGVANPEGLHKEHELEM